MGAPISCQDFLGLTARGDHHVLPLAGKLMGGGSGSLFGGVGVAAGMLALEARTNQPPVYMSCQFASKATPPEELVFTTQVLASGRTVSQARLTATVDDRAVLALVGATGSRREDYQGMWRGMPEAPPPEELEPLGRNFDAASLHHHVEVRMARGSFGFAPEDAPGRGTHSGDASTLFWTRMPGVHHDAAAVALMADYLPSAVGNALGTRVFCSSLDNTLRLAGPVEVDEASEWVLCESHVESVGSGFAANRGMVWRRDGTLLATANQSVTVATPRD